MTGSSVVTFLSVPGRSSTPIELARPEPMGELVAEPGQPEAAAGVVEQHGVVFHDRHAHAVERAAHALDVVPPVVIAEDGIDAEPRLEAREFGRPGRMRHPLGDETVGGEIIAEDHDQVGAERIGGIDHLAHALKAHIGAAGMQVGDHGDGEPVAVGPARRHRPVIGDDEIVGGFHRRIGGACPASPGRQRRSWPRPPLIRPRRVTPRPARGGCTNWLRNIRWSCGSLATPER